MGVRSEVTGRESAASRDASAGIGRTAKLLVVAVAFSMVPGIPMAVVKIRKLLRQQDETRVRNEREIETLKAAAQEGEAGEATRLLFGIEQQPTGR